ncbi:MAG: AzlC family ABC transporter permease [Bacteroidales bacterium]|nr:AzlC family ABC transporter permease [Bacteroidales bacterium]
MRTTTRSIFLHGMRDGFPIGMGYFAVSFSLGIIAAKAGLSAWMGFLGSFLTRASAGEYGVYSLIAIGASYVEVVAMCLVTNLRYLLMSTALTQKFASNVSLLKRILVACCVTDEIFGISIAYRGNLPPAYPFGAMIVSTTMWASGTAVGIVAGEILPPHVVAALSVALYGMFIAIIIPPSKQDHAVGIAVFTSFLLSWLCSVLPSVREMSAGTRTIVLTILIAAVAAYLKPIKVEVESDEA